MRTLNAEEIGAVFGGTDTGLYPPTTPPGPFEPIVVGSPDPEPTNPWDILICW